ncbi:MAG: type IV pilin protein [Sinimarinibacterium flocculans]|uniref:type IV pilin protein n=1 Tax=Sinimarinibacterium flocculans TaxID=985250 RepID=UPI003C334CA4
MLCKTARTRWPRGVTLIELVIALAIVGILVAVAVPSYQNYRLRVDRSAGKECLMEVHRRMETYQTRKNTYAATLTSLGYTGLSGGALTCLQGDFYTVSLAAPTGACPVSTCYRLIASPSGDQAKDGALRLTSRLDETDPNLRVVRERNKNGTWIPWDH